jgi:hypothetical protein
MFIEKAKANQHSFVVAIILRRVYSMFGDSNEYLEAMGCFDSFCEDEDE